MQAIYDCIPETSHIYRLYRVAAIFWLQFMVHVIFLPLLTALCCYINTFRGKRAVPNMGDLCSSHITHFPVVLFRYILNDFDMVPADAIINGVTFI